MNDEIIEAFRHASQGFSPDRVVSDPDLNRVYLSECNRLGLRSSAATLNRLLLNLRTRGALRGLASRRTILKDQPTDQTTSDPLVNPSTPGSSC